MGIYVKMVFGILLFFPLFRNNGKDYYIKMTNRKNGMTSWDD